MIEKERNEEESGLLLPGSVIRLNISAVLRAENAKKLLQNPQNASPLRQPPLSGYRLLAFTAVINDCVCDLNAWLNYWAFKCCFILCFTFEPESQTS